MIKKITGIIALCILCILTTSGCTTKGVFNVPATTELEEKDTLISVEDYKNNPDNIDIHADVTEVMLTEEELVEESSLIVIGKLTKVKGIAENPNGFPVTVYELKISDTKLNKVDNKDDIINFYLPNGAFNNVDLNKEIQLNKEYLFYLDLNTGGFSHLKEKYYGLISFKQGLLAADLYK